MKSAIIIFCTLVLSSSSCKLHEKDTYLTKEDLEGSWEVVKAKGAFDDFNLGIIYTFYKNNITILKSTTFNKGTGQITDSSFTFQSIDTNKPEIFFNYKFSNDTLIISTQHADQVLYLTKY